MITRPIIEWKKITCNIITVLIIDIVLAIVSLKLFKMLGIEQYTNLVLSMMKYIYLLPIENRFIQAFLFYLLVCILIRIKRILIFMVRMYQLFAPEQMRLSCLYTPSCSEYMIMAIEKYGCIKGVIKGINRLRRCHTPNGGVDYP